MDGVGRGKAVWSDVTAGGKKDGIPVGAIVAGTGAALGPHFSHCFMIRLRRSSLWSAGREEARVEAKALPVAVTSGVVGVRGEQSECGIRSARWRGRYGRVKWRGRSCWRLAQMLNEKGGGPHFLGKQRSWIHEFWS